MTARHRALYLITWLTEFCLFLLIFTVSRRLAEDHVGLVALGLIGSGLSLTVAVSSILSGRLSDRYGRWVLILLGSLLLLVSVTACAVLQACLLAYYLGFYWLGGLAVGMIYPSVIAWLGQSPGRGAQGPRDISRIMFFFCLSWNLGMIAGQMSGGWLFALGNRLPLAFAMGLAACNLALVLLTRGSARFTSVTDGGRTEQRRQLQTMSRAFARLIWVGNLGVAFSMGIIFHLFPELAVSLGIPAERHGSMLAIMRAVVIVVYFLMHSSTFWHYRFAIILIAQCTGVASLFMLTRAASEIGLTAGLAGLGVLVGYNYFASLYYSTTGSADERKGFASGIHEATLGLGLAAGCLAGGLIGSYGGSRAPYMLAMLVISSLTVVQIAMFVRGAGRLRETSRQ